MGGQNMEEGFTIMLMVIHIKGSFSRIILLGKVRIVL